MNQVNPRMRLMPSDSATEDFQIISSLRYDPALLDLNTKKATDSRFHPSSSPYYLLPYHQARLCNAAECFGWAKALAFPQQDLAQFSQFLDTFILDRTRPWRLRIVLDRAGACDVEVNPTAPIDPMNLLVPSEKDTQERLWDVYVDTERINPSAFTRHKTTARDIYNAARVRSGIMAPLDPKEVLLVNPEGQIMEGSITTPFFRRRRPRSEGGTSGRGLDSEWVTPPLSSGGNAGTTRQYALAEGFCTEQIIEAAALVDGEECWLSNGVRGFIRGRVVLQRPDEQQA
ncbi:aminodeoxychorismate lyase [Aspergillus saccharolyticus JOP 1030-1]|uniref:Aminodeoxychorismate lyase n=1 Tax=Aspergillus saccharolyticus JOP 1030-1 TaxID=1450539 RepID=A0A318ZDR2_9EURO|nr:aminodeoxychorismate lyase [Aspergillus saccharolyticus JOP 1030-1]PYH41670.1 aminodeoxychorismate lyase [Aspergillus saccharolyticus JOP 1030-1]